MARKGNQLYAVIYEGTDPQTGRQRRRWHPAGTDRVEAQELAHELATAAVDRRQAEQGRELTLETYVVRWWLPAKQRQLRATTLDGYRRLLRLHILPTLGDVLRGLPHPNQTGRAWRAS